VLGNSERFERARDHLAGVFFSFLERQYSKDEMRSIVLPLLERRHTEYESILDGLGDASGRLSRLGDAMIAHFVKEEVDEVRRNLASAFLLAKVMTEPAKKLKTLDEVGKIKW
jgi:hypothetical protein